MFLPVGFGGIFLNDILLANVAESGVVVDGVNVMHAMALPALGMLFGLLVAVFYQLSQAACLRCTADQRGRACGKPLQPDVAAGCARRRGRSLCHSAVAGFDDHGGARRLRDLLGVGSCALA